MPIRAECPDCQRAILIPDSSAGKKVRVRCKECETSFLFDAGQEQPEERLPERKRQEDKLSKGTIIKAACEECDWVGNVSEHLNGKKIRCKKCSAIVIVGQLPSAEDDEEEIRPNKKRRSSAKSDAVLSVHSESRSTQLHLSLVAAAWSVSLVIGLCLGPIVFGFFGKPTEPPLKKESAAEAGPRVDSPSPTAPPTDAPPPTPAPITPSKPLVVLPTLPNPPSGPTIPATKPADPGTPKPTVVLWKAKPDPGPMLDLTPQVSEYPLPKPRSIKNYQVHSRPSRYFGVCVGTIQVHWQIFDLVTGKLTGTLDVSNRELILSPDGKLMGGVNSLATEFTVYSVSENKEITTIKSSSKSARHSGWEFLDSSTMLVKWNDPQRPSQECVVYEIPTGKERSRASLSKQHGLSSMFSSSPGSRYVATGDQSDNANPISLKVYELTSGDLVGEIRLPLALGKAGGIVADVTFSHDGEELALLIREGMNITIFSFDMKNGNVKVMHNLKLNNPDGTIVFGALRWLPDRAGWWLNSHKWIDYRTGNTVYQLPDDTMMTNRFGPILVGKSHVLLQEGKLPDERWATHTLPKAEIEQRLAAMQKGTFKPEEELHLPKNWVVKEELYEGLPADTPSKLGQPINLKFDDMLWSVVSKTPAPSKVSPPESSSLSSPLINLLGIAWCDRHFVTLAAYRPKKLGIRHQFEARRYDLATGKQVDAIPLFTGPWADEHGISRTNKIPVQMCASPDGSLLAVRIGLDSRRVHIWNLAEKKPIASWTACEKGAIEDFYFLNSERLITVGGNQLALWLIPECRATHILDQAAGRIVMSPDRNFMAIALRDHIRILDPATFQILGTIPRSKDLIPMVGGALHPSTPHLAIVGPKQIAKINLNNGQVERTITYEPPVHQVIPEVQWANTLLRVGHDLYDWDFRVHLVTYTDRFQRKWMHEVGGPSPDLRHWLLVPLAADTDTSLRALVLPTEQAKQVQASVKAGDYVPAIPLEGKIQVRVVGPPEFAEKLKEAWTRRLELEGYRIGDGGAEISFTTATAQGGDIVYTGNLLKEASTTLLKVRELRIQVNCKVKTAGGEVISDNNVLTFRLPEAEAAKIKGDSATWQSRHDAALWQFAREKAEAIFFPRNVFFKDGMKVQFPIRLRAMDPN